MHYFISFFVTFVSHIMWILRKSICYITPKFEQILWLAYNVNYETKQTWQTIVFFKDIVNTYTILFTIVLNTVLVIMM